MQPFAGKIFNDTAKELDNAGRVWRLALGLTDSLIVDGQTGIDKDKPLAGPEVPLSLIDVRFTTIEGVIRSLPQDLPLATVSLNHLSALFNNAVAIRQLIDNLFQATQNIVSNGGFVPTTWADIHFVNPARQWDVAFLPNYVQPIISRTDAIVEIVNDLLLVASPGNFDFRYAAEGAAAARRTAEEYAKGIGEISSAIGRALQDAEGLVRRGQDAVSMVLQLEEDAKRLRDGIATIQGDTIARKAEADVVLGAAQALKVQVDEYAASFVAFQSVLDERNQTWKDQVNRLQALDSEVDTKIDQINDVVRKSQSMLATATNAGLTAAQERRYEELATELKGAGRAVTWSFIFMGLSVVPLAAYVVGNWNTTVAFEGGLEYAANIGLRAFLWTPALLYVGFATFRYRRLFRLKHEYGYRASLAGAVEGFKTQAPSHGEDIAAVAFYQLGLNPAEAIDGDHPSPPWYGKLTAIIERFADRFGKSTEKA